MIAQLWDQVLAAMTGLGYRLDPSEADSLRDRHFTVSLPSVQREDKASTFARLRVLRDVRIRLQFIEKKDTYFHRDITQEVERVVVALRPALLFESSTLIDRAGGKIAEISFSTFDTLS